ncbi:MAG: Fic family protein [Melioribacteraceae bacterium]|nr:Fic family protein [Melioribacteraceae bacterium]
MKDYAEKSKEEFAEKIGFFMCELIALHPFLELNGRITRLFFDMIAIYNGYEYIDYQDTIKQNDEDNLFIQASIDCMSGNESQMFQIILNGLKKAK